MKEFANKEKQKKLKKLENTQNITRIKLFIKIFSIKIIDLNR